METIKRTKIVDALHPHRLADGHRHDSGCGLGATVLQGKGEIVFHFMAPFLAMAELKRALFCSSGLMNSL